MRLNILISSAGRRNKLIECFRAGAKRLGVDAAVFAADACPALSPACHHADAAFRVPRCSEPEFDRAIKTICTEQKIGLLVPTIDTELAYYAANAGRFRNNGTHLNIASPETVAIAGDKLRFHDFLAENGIPTPRSGPCEMPASVAGGDTSSASAPVFPAIFKPRNGSRSIGVFRASDASEIPPAARSANYLWQECWTGREFTVAFYIGRDGRCRCVVPYERLEVRDGEISKGVTRRMPALAAAVRECAEKLPGGYGAMCAQAIVRDDGRFVLFELNARFGGGYPLVDNAGAHFAQWLVEDALGLPSTAGDHWAENRFMLRYDDAVFC